MSTAGELDLTFSGDGRITVDLGGDELVKKVLLQPDGKILVLGDSSGNFALTRLTDTGLLDTSFSGDGKVVTDFGDTDQVVDAIVQSDGKIVVIGSSNGNFALVRYTADGVSESNLSTDFDGPDDAKKVLIQGDGKILVIGDSDDAVVVARYRTDGSLDPSFSGDGKVLSDLGTNAVVNDAVLQTDGKLVVAGANGSDFALVRYNLNGTLDSSFGDSGIVVTNLPSFSSIQRVILQPDGKILAIGDNDGDFALARYTTDGKLDRSFSRDGQVVTDLGRLDTVSDAVVQPDGKILVLGTSDGRVALARYNADGTLDTSFSGDGTLTSTPGNISSEGDKLLLQRNGKIVVLATVDGNAGLVRYNSDGSVDNTFSGDGRILTNLASTGDSADAVLQPDGRVVLVGTDINVFNGDFAVGRFDGDAIATTVGMAPAAIDFSVGSTGLTLNGTRRNNTLTGAGVNDILTGRGGNDTLTGGAGSDRLNGSAGDDALDGGKGADQLIGGTGDDTLIGGKGGDVLVGGRGADLLTGGKGADQFVFNSPAEGGDTITDFKAVDLIDLRAIFAQPAYSGASPFARFNQFVQLVQVGSDTQVQVDADGNGLGLAFTTLATLNNVAINEVGANNFVIA